MLVGSTAIVLPPLRDAFAVLFPSSKQSLQLVDGKHKDEGWAQLPTSSCVEDSKQIFYENTRLRSDVDELRSEVDNLKRRLQDLVDGSAKPVSPRAAPYPGWAPALQKAAASKALSLS